MARTLARPDRTVMRAAGTPRSLTCALRSSKSSTTLSRAPPRWRTATLRTRDLSTPHDAGRPARHGGLPRPRPRGRSAQGSRVRRALTSAGRVSRPLRSLLPGLRRTSARGSIRARAGRSSTTRAAASSCAHLTLHGRLRRWSGGCPKRASKTRPSSSVTSRRRSRAARSSADPPRARRGRRRRTELRQRHDAGSATASRSTKTPGT